MSRVLLENSRLEGTVLLPPSKSTAHRALLCSFLAGGGKVEPMIASKDMEAMKSAVSGLEKGVKTIDCIESGNTLRFTLPVAAALGKSVTFTGSGRLPERPIGEYLRLFEEHGVKCLSAGGKIPVSIDGRLSGGVYKIAGNISSQYISGLLFALPLLEEDSEIILTSPLESKPYVDLTISVLRDYGIEITETENGYYVKGNQQYKKRDYHIESDWSHAAFFLAAGAVGGNVAVTGLNPDSAQGDKEIVDILKRFGADIEFCGESVRCRKKELRGINVDVTQIPDTVPAIAVTAAFARGETVITGAGRLRLKESDRIESVVSNLKKMGVNARETRDGMIITGGEIKGAELCGFNDHRIVMAFSVAALFARGDTVITDAQSINKTYPSFFEDYNRLGGKANVISDGE